MNNITRRKYVLDLIREHGGLSTADIATRFQVSKMTVHRDLDILERRGAVKRIFGGAIPVNEAAPIAPDTDMLHSLRDRQRTEDCSICFRPVSRHFLYSVTCTDGQHKWACCPHCGLSLHLIHQDAIVMAMTADFLSGKLMPARHAYFLVGSVAAPCCRPSVISFEEREMAERFQAGFGGHIFGFDEAVAAVAAAMTAPGDFPVTSCPHCRPETRESSVDVTMLL